MKPSNFFFILIAFCFLQGILVRELSGLPYSSVFDASLLLLWLIVLITAPKERWENATCDLLYLTIFWLVISILEVVNPGASVAGWLAEIKSAAVYPFLIVFISFLVFNNNRQLDIFLIIIICCSTLGAINGIKQLYIGPSRGEQHFLDMGGAVTHILWGKLRVFSFYSDAGQFGASQAEIGLIAMLLATMGPFKKWKKIALFICSLLILYGMLISGTRGALFALVIGGFMAMFLSKKTKVLIYGGILMFGLLIFLKFTLIGNGNYQIYRLRSAVNPQDASFNVRLNTQRILREYMSSSPLGGGLGVIGGNGVAYNRSNFLSTIQPDSYFVKVWVMYGIVGLTVWLCILVYIIGKCCGIVWRIEDEALRVKTIALASGCAGILFCSYANEVINSMPSAMVVYVSFVFVYLSPVLEKSKKSRLLT